MPIIKRKDVVSIGPRMVTPINDNFRNVFWLLGGNVDYLNLKDEGVLNRNIKSVDALKVKGKLEAGQIQVGEDSIFEEGYNPFEKVAIDEAGELAYEDLVEEAMLGETVIVGGYIKTDLVDASAVIADAIAADQAWFGEIAVGAYHEKDGSSIESEDGASSKADSAESSAKSHANGIVSDLADGYHPSGTFIEGNYIYSPHIIGLEATFLEMTADRVEIYDSRIDFLNTEGSVVGSIEGGKYESSYLSISGFEVYNGTVLLSHTPLLCGEIDRDPFSPNIRVYDDIDMKGSNLYADRVYVDDSYFREFGGSARLYNANEAFISVADNELLYRDADGNWHTVAFED